MIPPHDAQGPVAVPAAPVVPAGPAIIITITALPTAPSAAGSISIGRATAGSTGSFGYTLTGDTGVRLGSTNADTLANVVVTVKGIVVPVQITDQPSGDEKDSTLPVTVLDEAKIASVQEMYFSRTDWGGLAIGDVITVHSPYTA